MSSSQMRGEATNAQILKHVIGIYATYCSTEQSSKWLI